MSNRINEARKFWESQDKSNSLNTTDKKVNYNIPAKKSKTTSKTNLTNNTSTSKNVKTTTSKQQSNLEKSSRFVL